MPQEASFHHRATLKQKNKPFKSRHSSKGSLKDQAKGKVNRQGVKHSAKNITKKADRKNTAKLLQQKKRAALTQANRIFNGRNGAPKIVAVIPLAPDVEASSVVANLFTASEKEVPSSTGTVSLVCERFKQTFQFMQLKRNLTDILNATKVADYVLFVLSSEVEVDQFGLLCLSSIQAQGSPSVIATCQKLEEVPVKKQNDVKRSLLSFMNHFFPEMEKVHPVDNAPEAQTLLRLLSAQHPKSISWREPHPYMLIDQATFESNSDDETVGTLQITGFARGAPFSANRLVHLQNYGDFQIKQIVAAKRPNSSSHQDSMSVDSMDTPVDSGILDLPDEHQDDLISEMDPDPMAGEQTWPTEEELAEAEERIKMMESEREAEAKPTKRVPKGTSSYQAAWIVDSGSEDEYSDDGEDSNMVGTEYVDSDKEEYEDVANETDGGEDEDDNSEIDAEEEERSFQEYIQRQKESKDDLEFPDEVDTPLDVAARTRFQRYRGMLSIRTSPWDPYENLPADYSRIFQFENYPRTKVRVLGQAITGAVQPGSYITIHLSNVPKEFIETYDASRVNVAFGLLQYEHKMSVLNFIVNRNSEYQEPVKSKDPLILHLGFRRFKVQPVYSQHTTKGTNNVHKFERYLQQDLTSVATLYGPIQFGNVPAIFYKEQPGADPVIVATGSFFNSDPTRIIAKRIILTGYPFKVHKRSAVIRYMFLNPEDVHWFKPIQLTTKYGRTGHIKESLGTHGYMKCMFDGALKQHDTVCMYLYKRVFSKWNTELYRDQDDQGMMIEA
ncbi:DUF663-domain-containing protein [Basidiobolus meristosporus CBS 931.73]|uniref:DUF663-domain-containing protein n=1 Tax=Basidiobolus meristosporus CBS 931.73 TaxID=1314790 RepID=A0A1Y1YQP7_9FUNG|nr:DUF663-domain-containing protein [Basidiobolus meristosporus CBS 931.73]|eukprot:ORY00286.1 DUF663-domain-containing protein [Basidiobolus meristosporus CBS 931.73]